MITTRGLYVFKHGCTDSDEARRRQQAKLGGAPAHRLLDFSAPGRKLDNSVIDIAHREGLTGSPRSFADYEVKVNEADLPAGVTLLRIIG